MEGLQVFQSSNLVSEDSGFELNLHTLNYGKCFAKDEGSTSTNMIKNVENMLQQGSSDSSVLNKGNNTDEEIVTDKIFHSLNSHEQFTKCHLSSEEDKTSSPEEVCVCKELIPFDTTLRKYLRKAATFPSSEVESSLLSYTERNRNEESTSTAAPIQNSLGDVFPTYKRSTSLPASSILISAMKGGRAQNITLLRMDMRVKWAAEVYDPPTTLMSHTVKNNHHQRPKSNKKDNHKNKKHNKGKNCRGNNSGKKVSDRGNVGSLSIPIPAKCSPSQSCLQAGGLNGSAQSESGGKCAIEILEDVKCGNVFLRESLAKLHLAFGEAT